MTREIFQEGTFENGHTYAVLGRAVNGEAYRYNDYISVVGEDTIVVIPERNIAGVFDGAGGTTDIGSPLEASLTAARSVLEYAGNPENDFREAMQVARRAVIANQAAGLCVGALIHLQADGTVMVINAGDTGVAAFTPSTEELVFPGEQQITYGEPSNYLGRYLSRAPARQLDHVATFTPPHDTTELYVLSDGALGNWQSNTSLEAHHFAAAHDDYLLLRAAMASNPTLEADLKHHLQQPNFSLATLNWEEWENAKAFVKSYQPSEIPRDVRRFSTGLLDRLISWDFERHHDDDASMVVLNYQA